MSRPGRHPLEVGRLLVSLGLASAVALVLWIGERTASDEVRPSEASGTMMAVPDVLSLVAEVRGVLPHDPEAFTQGLIWYADSLFESTGEYGQSSLRQVEPATGRVLRRVDLEADRFGEGLERWDDRLVQLTWREEEALVWDLATFRNEAVHSYVGEGWGLCRHRDLLVRSDGTDRLFFHQPDGFALSHQIEVQLRGRPVALLNELECAEGWIYANVYGREEIVRIDPDSGEVRAVIDASGVGDEAARRAGVMNGIAYREDTASFYLTGKNWPSVYEVVFVPPS